MKLNPQFELPEIRCSGVDRLISCPASRTLERMRLLALGPNDKDGDDMTWRGNYCHFQSARRLVLEYGAIAPDGLSRPVLPKDWKPQPWDDRTTDWYVSSVMADTPPDHAIYVEHRIRHAFKRFILSGQIDTYTLNPAVTEFTIEDQKTGPNEVDHAAENWQLACYAALLKLEYPTLQKGKMRIRQRAAEVQTTEVELEIGELDTLVGFIEMKINAALDAWLTLETGYKACRLCPCIEFCPALHKEIEAMKLTLTEEELANLKVTQDIKQLATVAARGRAIAGPIDRLLDRLKERIVAEGQVVLDDGTLIRVVEEDGRRSVIAPKVATAFVTRKLVEETGCTEEEAEDIAWRTLSMSVSEIEDELVEAGMQRKSVKEDKETAQSWIRRTLGHLINRPKVKKLKFS